MSLVVMMLFAFVALGLASLRLGRHTYTIMVLMILGLVFYVYYTG